jgi:hypothetical protein
MATPNYRNTPPIGQNNNASCWAACLRFAMQIAKFAINGIPGIIGMHMNVVFDQRGPDSGKLVTCMEPWFPEGAADGRRTGAFLDKDINEFLRASPIVIARAN